MSKKILISTEQVEMEATLNNSKTASLIWDNLPLSGIVNTWGDEIYFSIPVEASSEDAVDVVELGDIAYWPEGKCFCIFFGQTPASTAMEIKPAGPVNLLGRLEGEPELWKKVPVRSPITLKKAVE